ncbi:MAG: hypothetical protein COT85_03220 [Chlamydiae bacterium CG10_big_fil_rev_8_21_14_0_10_42_34]|nr:MAG: hypothetical protein COT85_03220 [Chlamydiae bacterium CG10_big_fil_rev_8_21_14_0_10_42_34]
MINKLNDLANQYISEIEIHVKARGSKTCTIFTRALRWIYHTVCKCLAEKSLKKIVLKGGLDTKTYHLALKSLGIESKNPYKALKLEVEYALIQAFGPDLFSNPENLLSLLAVAKLIDQKLIALQEINQLFPEGKKILPTGLEKIDKFRTAIASIIEIDWKSEKVVFQIIDEIVNAHVLQKIQKLENEVSFAIFSEAKSQPNNEILMRLARFLARPGILTNKLNDLSSYLSHTSFPQIKSAFDHLSSAKKKIRASEILKKQSYALLNAPKGVIKYISQLHAIDALGVNFEDLERAGQIINQLIAIDKDQFEKDFNTWIEQVKKNRNICGITHFCIYKATQDFQKIYKKEISYKGKIYQFLIDEIKKSPSEMVMKYAKQLYRNNLKNREFGSENTPVKTQAKPLVSFKPLAFVPVF